MTSISSLSPLRAMLIALAWPALLFAAPALIVGWTRLFNWVQSHSGADSFTQTFVVVERASGPSMAAMLLTYGPPLLFLMIWWFKRRRATA
jgi:hypothetical protein